MNAQIDRHDATASDNRYAIRCVQDPRDIEREAWNGLLAMQPDATPFMRHEYLCALHASASAVPETGWSPHFITLWCEGELQAACPLYVKTHSYGEYVFDWAWANAYAQHGLSYYPKAVMAVPFTPVPGARLLARDEQARQALLQAALQFCQSQQLSSLHALWLSEVDQQTCQAEELMSRQTVQFHWHNTRPGYSDFDAFLSTLTQEKRKKIRQERRKVAEAGVRFRTLFGEDITPHDWDFFYRCYVQTYLEHRNAPYLTRDFFTRMAHDMPENWVMFVAERDAHPIACSLVAISARGEKGVAYGRYWGAIERVDCLHFEACYYQPLQWCIANGLQRFEGGAQGEHKLARALLPVGASSAHWLAHPAFAEAVSRYVTREAEAVGSYLEDLNSRSPLK